jgi:phosphate starvation-inducible membrane PsiE
MHILFEYEEYAKILMFYIYFILNSCYFLCFPYGNPMFLRAETYVSHKGNIRFRLEKHKKRLTTYLLSSLHSIKKAPDTQCV